MSLSINTPGTGSAANIPDPAAVEQAKKQIKGVNAGAYAVVNGHSDAFEQQASKYISFVDELIGVATDSSFIGKESIEILLGAVEQSGNALEKTVPVLEGRVDGTLKAATAGMLAVAKDWFEAPEVVATARGEAKGHIPAFQAARAGALAAIEKVRQSKAKIPGETTPPSGGSPAPSQPEAPKAPSEGGEAKETAPASPATEAQHAEGSQAPAPSEAAPSEAAPATAPATAPEAKKNTSGEQPKQGE